MRRTSTLALALTLLPLTPPAVRADGPIYLDSLEMNLATQPQGTPQRNLSANRTPLTVAGKTYPTGLGVIAPSRIWIALGRGADRFKAEVGLDDTSSNSSAEFVLAMDGKTVWRSGPLKKGDAAKPIDLDVRNHRYLCLAVESKDSSVKANWLSASFSTIWSDPTQADPEKSDPYILTPPTPPTPHLNNALRYGLRPNAPLSYTIPCTGERPLTITAANLPEGVTLKDNRLTGSLAKEGEYPITLTATNAQGTSTKTLTLVVGEKLALTPPMGWSSWNVWCAEPSQARALSAANAMVKFDLINHGFSYINIDDGWQGTRAGEFNGIQPNPQKFPDMPGLINQVHAMGLKFGIYSSPWINSYCGFNGGTSDDEHGAWSTKLRDLPKKGWTFGKYNLSQNDAKQWAAWGVDYLKYDWFPNDEPHTAEMAGALRATNRDIVFSLSNSSKLHMVPWLTKYTQLWRASGDIRDTWPSISTNGFGHADWASITQPGAWPDPDMLVIGRVGFGQEGWGQITRPSNLTPDEQYTHISLWSLLAAPLLLGCDLERLDPFTLNLITNDEVLEVDQDPLGKAASRASSDYFHELWSRPLADGSIAVGLFNISPGRQRLSFTAAELHLEGQYTLRDLWRQKDLGTLNTQYTTSIPAHGVLLLRLTPVKP